MLSDKTYLCGIGAQKSGTTFIANYLSKHPSFSMSPLKELHYFNTKANPNYSGAFEKKLLIDINKMVKKVNEGEKIDPVRLFALVNRVEAARRNNYSFYFKHFVQEKHIAFGEITPAYSTLSRDEYAKIIKIFPNHKFLFLLRNPVDRFWSQLNFELQNEKNTVDPLSLIDEKLRNQAYVLRSDYKRTIKELLAVTDENNIFIEFYENIFSDKGTIVIEKLSSFLNIEYRKDLLNINEKINVTSYKSSITEDARMKIAYRFKDVYEYVMEKFDVPNSWRKDYDKYLK